jgi:flagellar FliJ protein
MRGFKFRLQSVLEYKETVERSKQEECGKIKKELDEEEAKLKALINHKEKLNSERNNILEKTTINNLQAYNNFMSTVANKLKNQEKNVDNKKEELNKARAKLIEAVREVKAIEKLKDKKYQEYNYTVKKDEEKQIDQLINFNYYSK